MIQLLKKFGNDESGATAIEYGLIAALVGVAIVIGAGALGDSLDELFAGVASELSTATDALPNAE